MSTELSTDTAKFVSRYELLLPGGRILYATEEQEAIIDFALGVQGPPKNLLINALAGAAKTSTLRFLCKYMSIEPTLSLAFNKKIADEMAKVLPGHVTCATMNSVGHRVWASFTGKKLILETKKNYNLVKEFVDALPRHLRGDAYEIFGDMTKTISKAKLAGYVPPGVQMGRSLVERDAFYGSLEEAYDDWFADAVDKCIAKGIAQAYAGLIDFDDQIYMSTLFGGSFPQYRRVLGDEGQDFNRLNQEMLTRLVGRDTWLGVVGDPWQSIYAFRGADTASMSWLRDKFDMHEMTLSVSFRCPISVVKRAHKRVPHMKWAPWAIEGAVTALDEWSTEHIPENAAIICRNNAPLMTCALALLRAGRGVHLLGTDLGPQLVKALKKLTPDLQTPQERVLELIDTWEQEKLRKARDKASTADRAECLRVFAGFGKTLSEAIGYCEGIFAQKGTIQLMSGHKSKGLEFDTVFHLDPQRIPSPWAKEGEALEQELNVEYVIETRMKKELFLVRLDQFNGDIDA